jgi:DNA polymerase-4
MRNKIILHYDMDCFFAAVEIRDNPSLAGKPIIVGESIVTTASYEARKFGIHSAMSVYEAKKLCPKLIVVPVSKDKYGEVAYQIQGLVQKISEQVEFLSFDEGFADITEIINSFPSKDYFAQKFRDRIFEITKLSCSVGIGYNKLTAKMASEVNKPQGHFIFNNPEEFVDFIKNKKINIIPGVGKKFQEILEEKSFIKISDLYKITAREMCRMFGNSRGALLYNVIRGIDHSRIEFDRMTQSIGNENTFKNPLILEEEIDKELDEIFQFAYNRLISHEFICKTVTLKVKFSDMESITRSKTFQIPTDVPYKLKKTIIELLEKEHIEKPIRLLGIYFGNLIEKSKRQLNIDFNKI